MTPQERLEQARAEVIEAAKAAVSNAPIKAPAPHACYTEPCEKCRPEIYRLALGGKKVLQITGEDIARARKEIRIDAVFSATKNLIVLEQEQANPVRAFVSVARRFWYEHPIGKSDMWNQYNEALEAAERHLEKEKK